MNFLQLQKKFSYRRRVTIIAVGMFIGITSIFFMSRMANMLREKERNEVELWAYTMSRQGEIDYNDPFISRILKNNSDIPFIIIDDQGRVISSKLIPDHIINHPDLLHKKMDRMRGPTEIPQWNGSLWLFYGRSNLLNMLVYFPIVQIFVIGIFIVFGFITFHSSKHDEQNRVWIGLAKETAHQLGTPTSSLLGWLEYLRSQPIDRSAVDEIAKDLTRLSKVVDRFSKIGSETVLKDVNVNELVGNSVLYFRTRIPRNVSLDYNGLAIAPLKASVNEALFEWVVENLLKNALDALQGTGRINVHISDDADHIFIDVSDTGKGIAKANFKRVFEPGFTTKTRGWGLGLSLSRRIIEEYHKGRIGVHESEPGKGTTMRITLKKSYG